MKRFLQKTTIAAALLFAPGLAAAQQAQAGPSSGGQQSGQAAGAGQCTDDLTAFGRRMDEEGFWLSGYRRSYGWLGAVGMGGRGAALVPGMAPGAVGVPGALAPAEVVGGGVANTARAGVAEGGAAGRDPFAGVDWQAAPAQALRALYAAAHVLAQNGDGRACQVVLAEARELYGSYTAQLRRAGVEPGEIRTYRQRQLVLARPVAERARGMRADAITGTDVRNPQDEYLGHVEDVVFDPRTGEIAYAVIGRGGFLGIGRDHVAVPWQRMRATPNLDTFVLDMREAQLEAAPKVDPDAFATDEGYARRRGEIDRFWRAGRAG